MGTLVPVIDMFSLAAILDLEREVQVQATRQQEFFERLRPVHAAQITDEVTAVVRYLR